MADNSKQTLGTGEMRMQKSAVLVNMLIVIMFFCVMVSFSWAGLKVEFDEKTSGIKMKIDKNTKAEIGVWAQTWYQWVEDGKR